MKKHLHFCIALLCISLYCPALLAQNSSPFWSLSGNSNATTSSKLGTTNSIPLRLLTNNLERLRIDISGKVGIGTTTPTGKLTVFGSGSTPASAWVTSGIPIFAGFGENTAGNADHILAMASNLSNARAVFLGRKARGTLAAPMAVQNNDYLLSLFASGYDGHSFQSPATVDFFVDGAVSTNNVPTRISLSTGSAFANRIERLKVGSSGNFDFNNGQLYVDQASGNIGVGTKTPFRHFQVQEGDIRMQTVSSFPHYLEFVRTGASPDWRFEHSSGGRYLYLSFSTDDFTSFVDKAVFDTTLNTNGYSFYHYGKADGYAWDVFSDGKLKTGVSDLTDAIGVLARLKPKTYHFKQGEYAALHLPPQKQYGLIAQELEQVLPELVTASNIPINRNSKGERQMEEIKSVNYIGIIPLLIKASQDQQQHIQQQDSLLKKQQQQIDDLNIMVTKLSGGQLIKTATGSLEQNTPNPGNNSTRIAYSLPSGTHRAQLVVVDNGGNRIKTVQLTESGSVNLNLLGLAGGIYHYSLLVDDLLVDTKQMVISR